MRRKLHQKRPITGIKLTVSGDLIDMGGYVILAKDQVVTVTDIYFDAAGYDGWGYWHDEQWTSVCVKERPGYSWTFSAFTDKDVAPLKDKKFIEWFKEKNYKFHHGGWYRGGQSVSRIRTFQQLYEKYGDEIERENWNKFIKGFDEHGTKN
jgi:hypothetical protein